MFECIPFKLKSHLTEMLCNHSTQFQAHLGKVPCYRQSQPSSLSWSHGWGSTAFCISASLYCCSGLYGVFIYDAVSNRMSQKVAKRILTGMLGDQIFGELWATFGHPGYLGLIGTLPAYLILVSLGTPQVI